MAFPFHSVMAAQAAIQTTYPEKRRQIGGQRCMDYGFRRNDGMWLS